MFFERILAELDQAKIRYLLIGGVAVNLHGFPRATGDLDILMALDSRNIKKFINMVKKLKWKPRVPVELESFAENYVDFKKAYRRKKVISVGHIKVPVASIEDLIRLKRIAGRERDEIDIRALMEIRKLKK